MFCVASSPLCVASSSYKWLDHHSHPRLRALSFNHELLLAAEVVLLLVLLEPHLADDKRAHRPQRDGPHLPLVALDREERDVREDGECSGRGVSQAGSLAGSFGGRRSRAGR